MTDNLEENIFGEAMSLDAVGIVSSNLSKAVEFYGLLGVELKQVGGEGHLEGNTPSGVRIMLDSEELMKEINPNWIKPTGSAIVLCFKQNSSSEVNSLYSKIIEAGFNSVKEPWDAFWGQRYASVSDSDGNQVDLFAVL